MRIIYADNNATTAGRPGSLRGDGCRSSTDDYFNPSSMYEPARRTAHALAEARAADRPALRPGRSAGRSSSPAAPRRATTRPSSARPRPIRTAAHVITTAVEHPAVLEVCKDLERNGYEVTFLGVDGDGNLDVGEFVRALRPDTLLVSDHARQQRDGRGLSHRATLAAGQGNRSGDRLPHRRHAIGGQDPHRPAARATARRPALVLGPQAARPQGHRRAVHQARHALPAVHDRRPPGGRPPGGDGKRALHRRAWPRPCELAAEHYEDEADADPRPARPPGRRPSRSGFPTCRSTASGAPRLPNTLNVSCHYVEGEGMLYQLSDCGICASSGSACTSGSLEPSHVLRAMKVPFTAVHGSIRFSFSRYNTDDDMDRIIEVFPQIVANLRRLSPYWDQEQNCPRPDADARIQ